MLKQTWSKKMHQTQAEYFQVIETEYSSKVKLSPPQLLSPKCLLSPSCPILITLKNRISNTYVMAEVLRFYLETALCITQI